MKKFVIFVVLLISILLAPLFTSQNTAFAGRTQSGFGFCDCATSSDPCYDETTGERCDSGNFSMYEGGGSGSLSATPIDLGSGVLIILAAAFLTSRFLRIP